MGAWFGYGSRRFSAGNMYSCPKNYLSGAPPSVGAERTENFEKSRPLRRLEMAFPRLVSIIWAAFILSPLVGFQRMTFRRCIARLVCVSRWNGIFIYLYMIKLYDVIRGWWYLFEHMRWKGARSAPKNFDLSNCRWTTDMERSSPRKFCSTAHRFFQSLW